MSQNFKNKFTQNPLATYATADKATKYGFGDISELDDILGVTNSYRFYSNMLEHKTLLGKLELKFSSIGGKTGGILLDHVRREKRYFDAITQVLDDKFLMLGTKK